MDDAKKYIKYSDIPIRNKLSNNEINIKKVTYIQTKIIKPSGFWYGIKHHWINFYNNGQYKLRESYKLESNKNFMYVGNLYEINLPKISFTRLEFPDKNKILILETKKDFLMFGKTYGNKTYKLDWKKVADDFGGIEVRYDAWYHKDGTVKENRIFSIDKDYLWYDVFDVPSGCIWSSNILLDMRCDIV